MTDQNDKLWVRKIDWYRAELSRRLVPAMVKQGVDLACLDDLLARALVHKNTVLGGSADGTDVTFDPNWFLSEARDDPGNVHIFSHRDNGAAAKSGNRPNPEGWPAGAPDESSDAFRALAPEARLRIANEVAAYQLAKTKAP